MNSASINKERQPLNCPPPTVKLKQYHQYLTNRAKYNTLPYQTNPHLDQSARLSSTEAKILRLWEICQTSLPGLKPAAECWSEPPEAPQACPWPCVQVEANLLLTACPLPLAVIQCWSLIDGTWLLAADCNMLLSWEPLRWFWLEKWSQWTEALVEFLTV